MSEAMGIALPAEALTAKQIIQGGPYFCAIKKPNNVKQGRCKFER
ncbi:hypothetical protein [Aminipila luticellarii]|nr:hypothetical protein [Aminipila luticellarii]